MLKDLLEFINRALNRRDNPYCCDMDISNAPKKDVQSYTNRRTNFTSLANSPLPTASKSGNNTSNVNVRFCVICKNNSHYLNQCVTFRGYSYSDRLKLANEHKLCFSCLLPGHVSNACSRQKSCRNCGGRHTTLLHPDISSKSDSSKQCNLNKTSLNSTSNVV